MSRLLIPIINPARRQMIRQGNSSGTLGSCEETGRTITIAGHDRIVPDSASTVEVNPAQRQADEDRRAT